MEAWKLDMKHTCSCRLAGGCRDRGGSELEVSASCVGCSRAPPGWCSRARREKRNPTLPSPRLNFRPGASAGQQKGDNGASAVALSLAQVQRGATLAP